MLQLPWPELTSFPGYGLVMPRDRFDHLLAQRAVKAGARLLERTEAVAPVIVDGWVQGAEVRPTADKHADTTRIRARFVVAADGAAGRFARPAGVQRDDSRPLGIAARRYYRTSYHPGPWFESWLDLWDGDMLLPGYGWLFPVAGGRINLGAGLLNTFRHFEEVSAQQLFAAFARMLPAEWGLTEDATDGRLLSGPLPMSFNRSPQAVPGMLVVGDAAGAVNPFNGEGLAMRYPQLLSDTYGRYFFIGRQFAKIIGNPAVMGRATKYLLPNRRVMAFALRVMGNLTDGRDGDAQDRLLHALTMLARAS
jgi:flavin-dependent dehydrogenase